MRRLTHKPGSVVKLRNSQTGPEQVHVFAKREIQAINTALASGRPLLLRGEPGVGKSQLALAAARGLGRAFVATTVDANTEAHDLLWRFDAVARLAEAQVQGAILHIEGVLFCTGGEDREAARQAARKSIETNLAVGKFVHPQALWWALNWKNAATQAKVANVSEPAQDRGYNSENGVVALIDEIDKAGGHVPNGLLEALGAGSFKPFGVTDRVLSLPRAPHEVAG